MAAWQGYYCVVIIVFMFGALLRNVAGPDVLMLGSLAAMLAADAVPIPDALKGFSNKGLLTVACLFVVAAGISNTHALDYYMGKLLGHPKNAAQAQIRLMVPVAFVSAFLNNTPVVAIMIPILQKWSRRVGIPNSQLMIPLSFASILGGTCTLIGTSTNLVVEGMMRERYPEKKTMGLFALSIYGIPVALSGMAYILVASPFLLPGGKGRAGSGGGNFGKHDDDNLIEDSLAVGAVVAPKSPVIDQPVAKLRGLNGLYLVSVQRGDMLLRAVTPEFILEEGDVLHFTGLVESIGEVCLEFGLLPLTHEVEESWVGLGGHGTETTHETEVVLSLEPRDVQPFDSESKARGGYGGQSARPGRTDPRELLSTDTYPPRVRRASDSWGFEASKKQDGNSPYAGQRARHGHGGYKDVLHAFAMDDGEHVEYCDGSDGYGGTSTGPESDGGGFGTRARSLVKKLGARRRRSSAGGVLRKRGAGHDTATGRGTGDEALGLPSMSPFTIEGRGDVANDGLATGTGGGYRKSGGGAMAMHEVLNAKETPPEVRRALLERHQILKVRVRPLSSLVGHTAAEVRFREKYSAAIIAVQQRNGENALARTENSGKLASVVFQAGDVLMLHCLDACPLLQFKGPALGASGGSATRGSISTQSSQNISDMAGDQNPGTPVGWGGGADSPTPFDSKSCSPAPTRRASVDNTHGDLGRGGTPPPTIVAPVPSRPSPSRPRHVGGGDLENIDGLSFRSRASTPGFGNATSDPDLEVLSREGAEDIRAMTDFTCPVRVIPGGAVEGKTLQAAGLRGLPGLFLTAVQKPGGLEKDAVAAPGAEYVLTGDDVLWYAGDAAGISSLRRIPGITSENRQVDKLKLAKTDRRLVQAVVAIGSPLTNRQIRDVRFRTRYDAVIIAVQRSGGRIQRKIGEIVLQAGDVLLLDTGSSFLRLYKADPAFALVSEIENSAPPQFDKLLPACGTALLMIIVTVAGVLDLFVAALLASGVMLLCGCLTQDAARASVNWTIITTIAAAFGISAAMENTGVASAIATTLVNAASAMGAGKPGVLIAVYVATVFLCNIVGNNAAAALMYPIAAGASERVGIDRDQMAYLLMLAASASFMSPFGYQTNLMVYGPGAYVFQDFLRFGVPMQVVQMVVSVGVVLLGDSWWVGWVTGFGACFGIYAFRSVTAALALRSLETKNGTGAASFAKQKLARVEEAFEKGPNAV